MEDLIARRLEDVRARIAVAAARAARRDQVALVAVTKTVPPDLIRAAYVVGQRQFGENRVQEATIKIDALRDAMPEASWHLVGHLQSNKARAAVERFDVIESVDSLRLARRLDGLAGDQHARLSVLLEVNVSGEAAKSGFPVERFEAEIEEIVRLPWLEVRGLMTVAPLEPEPRAVRPVFHRLRELRDSTRARFRLQDFDQLSMGMSNDFEVAIEEGATMVRIGRALFGERAPAPGPG